MSKNLSEKSSTQLYKRLTEAFPEKQARAIVEMFQEFGLIEEGKIGDELETLEKLLEAEPFQPFMIEIGKSQFLVNERNNCGFNRFGSVMIRDGKNKHILSNEHIVRVVSAQQTN